MSFLSHKGTLFIPNLWIVNHVKSIKTGLCQVFGVRTWNKLVDFIFMEGFIKWSFSLFVINLLNTGTIVFLITFTIFIKSLSFLIKFLSFLIDEIGDSIQKDALTFQMIVCLESCLCRLFCCYAFEFIFILLIWRGIQFCDLLFAIALQSVIVQVWDVILTYHDLLQKLFCLFKFNKLALFFVTFNLVLLHNSLHLLIGLNIYFCMKYFFFIVRKGEILI